MQLRETFSLANEGQRQLRQREAPHPFHAHVRWTAQHLDRLEGCHRGHLLTAVLVVACLSVGLGAGIHSR